MTHRAPGSSCSAAPQADRRRRLRWVRVIQIVILVVLLAEILRHVFLSQSLYNFNTVSNTSPGAMPAPRAGKKIVIFAPHEDDETLGCGGYIQQAVAAGADVRVVLMTNGEYPELSLVLFEERLPISSKSFIALGYARQRETLAAMRSFGLPADHVLFLGYPNQYLNQMWEPEHWLAADPVRSVRLKSTRSPYNNAYTPGAVFCGDSMLRDVETILQAERPDVVITLHPNDEHVDHWPTGIVARFALAELAMRGEAFAAKTRVYTYLIHRDYWPVPRKYRPFKSLKPPSALARNDETRWLALPLTVSQTLAKHKATRLYHSQGPALDPLLSAFSRSNELFGVQAEHNWPARIQVPPITVINDPTGDIYTAVQNPSADISEVTLARAESRMVVEIHTRRNVTRAYGYHFSMHATQGDESTRMFADYHVIGWKLAGMVLHGQTLEEIEKDGATVVHDNNTVRITVPWLLNEDRPVFLSLRAWTTHGRHVVDQTAETVFRITPPVESAPSP